MIHQDAVIYKGTRDDGSAERAEYHLSFKCQVDDTASFGEHTGQGNYKQRGCVDKGFLKQEYHY